MNKLDLFKSHGALALLLLLSCGNVFAQQFCIVNREKARTAIRLADGDDSARVAPVRKAASSIISPADIVYQETFPAKDSFDKMVVSTTDPSGRNWEFLQSALAAYSNAEYTGLPSNKWMFTPSIALEGNTLYKLTFLDQSLDVKTRGSLEVLLGKGTAPEKMDTTLLDSTFINYIGYQTKESFFTVGGNGSYNLGFHNISGINEAGFIVDSIVVERLASLVAPDSVSSFSVTPGENGKLSATVSLRVPSTTVGGKTLASVSKVDILRDGQTIKTFDNPVAGSNLTFTDSTMAKAAVYDYKAVAYSGTEHGIAKEISLFIGEDVPDAPGNITISDAGNDILMKWEAPSTGVHGGYINPSALRYDVFTVSGSYAYFLKQGLKDTQTLLGDNPDQGTQRFTFYAARTTSNVGESDIYISNSLLVGKPYTLPYRESFKGGNLSSFVWFESKYSIFDMVTDRSFDNDRGCLKMAPSATIHEGTLYTGKIDVSKSDNYKLVFYHTAKPGRQIKLYVEAMGPDWHPVVLDSIDYSTISGKEQWRKAVIPLKSVSDNRFIALGFRVVSPKSGSTLYIDNINIADVPSTDLSATVEPTNAQRGRKAKATVTVHNNGESDVRYYRLKVTTSQGETVCDTLVSTKLLSMESADYTVSFTPSVVDNAANMSLEATVTAIGDRNSVNNTSTGIISLSDNTLEPVRSLALSADNNKVKLTWQSPDNQPISTSEDFEGYEAWSTDFAPWTNVDGDGNPTNPLFRTYFPHQEDPFGFIVDNAVAINLPNIYSNFRPHSGRQCAMSVISSQGGKVDNWLISPRLDGSQQQVTFYASAASMTAPLSVLASSESSDTASFTTVVMQTDSLAADWKQYSVTLPAGTRYFAFHTFLEALQNGRNHYDTSPALLIDDVRFVADAHHPLSYNIYVDGKLSGSVLSGKLSWPTADNGAHDYQVSVVYAEGESKPVSIVTTGIEKVSTGAVANGKIYSAAGFYLGTTDGLSLDRLSLQPGLYIIKCNDGTTKKFMVK